MSNKKYCTSKPKVDIGKKTLFNKSNNENNPFMRVDDLMEYTGLARQTIYNKMSAGLIPYRKWCGKVFFEKSEIDEAIFNGD